METYSAVQFPIILRLHSGGAYEVRWEFPLPTTERGKWEWNELRREFLLEPAEGNVQFALRRLRVDERDPDRLQWIVPMSDEEIAAAAGGGVIEYVSFKRQKE